MTLSEAPAPVMPALPLVPVPASVHAADGDECHRDLRERFLHAGRDAVDDRELLQLLLSPSHPTDEAATLAGTLLETFGSAARVLAARSERLGAVGGLGETAVAAIKTAEALGIRLARARLPDRIQPALDGYARVIDYCRTLAGHREVEEFRLLFLNTKNRLMRDELHQTGTVNHTPAYPREICIRALEVNAAALVVIHNHPGGDPSPSQADVDMTNRIRDALKLIEVALHDHIIVTPGAAFSFREKGLL